MNAVYPPQPNTAVSDEEDGQSTTNDKVLIIGAGKTQAAVHHKIKLTAHAFCSQDALAWPLPMASKR